MDDTGNLFHQLPADGTQEHFQDLLKRGPVRIERIVSHGQVSPPGFWYDQDENEWVMVVRGRARLQIEDRADVELGPGDWVDLPAHRRHRVAWTDPEGTTVWLAVFY